MATLMDVIMEEYRGQQGAPDYTLGSRRTMMQPSGQFNDAGRLGNMGLRQALTAQGQVPQPAPVGSGFFPPRAEGDTGLSTPITQTLNRRPQIPPEVYDEFVRTVNPLTRNAPMPVMAQRPLPEVLASRDDRTVVPMIGGDYNDVFNAPYTPAAVPLPPRIPGGQTRGVREPGFFERLFGGTQYQSNSLPVNAMPQGPMPETGAPIPSYINWANAGGPEGNAADFFAADKLLMQQNPAMFGLLGGTNG
jgi:hypothetical protein